MNIELDEDDKIALIFALGLLRGMNQQAQESLGVGIIAPSMQKTLDKS